MEAIRLNSWIKEESLQTGKKRIFKYSFFPETDYWVLLSVADKKSKGLLNRTSSSKNVIFKQVSVYNKTVLYKVKGSPTSAKQIRKWFMDYTQNAPYFMFKGPSISQPDVAYDFLVTNYNFLSLTQITKKQNLQNSYIQNEIRLYLINRQRIDQVIYFIYIEFDSILYFILIC